MQACSNAGQDEAHRVQQEAAKYMPAEQIPSVSRNPGRKYTY